MLVSSAVMLHRDTIDVLFLDSVPCPGEIALAIRSSPIFAPDLHSRRILNGKVAFHAMLLQHRTILHRYEAHIIVRHREVEDAETGVAPLVRRRLHDAVDRRLVVSAREELERVAGVEDERVGNVAHPAPAAVGREDLESGDRLRPEDGDSAEVGVAFQPDVLGEGLFLGCAWVAGEGNRYLEDAKDEGAGYRLTTS